MLSVFNRQIRVPGASVGHHRRGRTGRELVRIAVISKRIQTWLMDVGDKVRVSKSRNTIGEGTAEELNMYGVLRLQFANGRRSNSDRELNVVTLTQEQTSRK